MIIYIKIDLALNNLQRLICHKNQPTYQLIILLNTIYAFTLHQMAPGISEFHKKFN